jgi:hypothetical protein
LIHFVSASDSPDATIEDPVDGGALLWLDLLPDADGATVGVWDSGESLTLTMNFTALASDTHENCAFADAMLYFGEAETEFGPIDDGCEPYHIAAPAPAPTNTPRSGGGGGGGSSARPTARATDVPPSTPVPVSTVAAATVVPPVRTVVPVGISAPDTGTGDGLGSSTNTIELLIVLLAGTAGIVGAMVLRRSTP